MMKNGEIYSYFFSTDILSGSEDRCVYLYDKQTGRLIQVEERREENERREEAKEF